MCGIVGISAESNVASEIYESLLMLQHRGQDAAGMVVCDDEGRLNSRKSMGYVRDVFQQRHMEKLIGSYGVGHVRYPTAGGAGKEFAQPMYVNSPYGISLAHNGNLTNSKSLAKELFFAEMRHLNTDSDSEVLLNILAHEIAKQKAINPTPEHLFKAVSLTKIMTKLTKCKYRVGLTGTLDGTKTHKLVLEGLFGSVNKVVSTTELMEKGKLSDLKIFCLVLQHGKTERDFLKDKTYQEEMDYLVANTKRNKFIEYRSTYDRGPPSHASWQVRLSDLSRFAVHMPLIRHTALIPDNRDSDCIKQQQYISHCNWSRSQHATAASTLG